MEIPPIVFDALPKILPLAFLAILGFTLYGLPLCVGLHALLTISSEQAFTRRFAKHILVFTSVLQLTVLVATALWLAWLVYTLPSIEVIKHHTLLVLSIVAVLAISLCAILALWIAKRKVSKYLVLFLAVFWMICNTVLLIVCFFDGYYAQMLEAKLAEQTMPVLSQIMPILQMLLAKPVTWCVLGRAILFACMSAGALSLIWLIMRRKRDDFGRDYYVYAIRTAARWALFSALALCALYGFVLLSYPHWLFLKPFIMYSALICILVGALLWYLVQASATPVRYKMSIIGGAVCVVCLVMLQFFNNLPSQGL